MKALQIIVLLLTLNNAFSQEINWKALQKDQKHIVNINAGLDYSFMIGAGYGYKLKTCVPVVAGIEYSSPLGNDITDDFKTKIGAQVMFYKTGDLYVTGKAFGIFRRYENDFVRLLNFGSDVSLVAGLYKTKWFVAGETGFDKAIVTHFKHSDLYKENYPLVQDGWYQPATGGNFYYGFQTGYSFKTAELTLKMGRLLTQDFKIQPMLPFYARLGINLKFE